MAVALITVQGVAALVVGAAFGVYGLSIDAVSFAPPVVACGVLYAVGLYLRRQDDSVADFVLAAALIASASLILSPAQYAAAATRRPLIDRWLAAADASLGVDVGALSAWTSRHPAVHFVLALAYSSLLLQFVLTPAIVLWLERRDRLWDFLIHFHVCAVVTVAALAAFPAACAFQYLDFTSAFDQSRFTAQFNGVRSGALRLINFQELEGLISVPSFHVAGALFCTWAVRGLPPFWSFAVLNTCLVAATFMTGAHYAVDVPITMAMCSGLLGLGRVRQLRSFLRVSRSG